jgi:hypothetical protein
MKEVWPDAFVEEGGLARNISVLRKTLSQCDCENQYIETLPKVGYRFVARVKTPGIPAGNLTVERHTVLHIVTKEVSGWSFSLPELLKQISTKRPCTATPMVHRRLAAHTSSQCRSCVLPNSFLTHSRLDKV